MLLKGKNRLKGEGFKALGEMSTIGFVLVASTLIGFFIGRYVGAKQGQETAGVLVGTIMGATAGFIEMFSIARKYMK